MKDQTSPTAVEIISDSVEHIEQSLPRKLLDANDVTTNIDSDEDSGFLNASNGSLNTYGAEPVTTRDNDITERMENSEQPATPVWRLKIPAKSEALTDENLARNLKTVSEQVVRIPEAERRKWVMDRMTETFGEVLPEPLLEIATAHNFEGDSGISMDVKPDWLDVEKFRRGQRFARDNLFGIYYAEMVSLFTVFSFETGLKPLIATGASGTPYTAFKRYLSTGSRIRNWYTYDPWTPGTPAYNDMRTVRRTHAMVRKRMESMSDEEYLSKTTIKDAWCPTLDATRRDFQSTCPAPAPGQCPYTVLGQLPTLWHKQLSQGEMSVTQFAFIGLIILSPKTFGLHHATEQDLEDFCHVWRGIGYLLGIDDNFNFCRGTLEDVKARSSDFLEYWVKPNFREAKPEWEHMMRCMIEGLQYYYPGSTYETSLLDLAEIMNLHMPRLYNSMTYRTWIKHGVIRLFFNHGSKIPALRSFMNHQLEQAIERANKYDEKKHNELQEKSRKTLDSYIMESQKHKTPITECFN